MAKFHFRLDRLREYRKLQEKWAKDEYLARRAKRLEGELEIERVKALRMQSLTGSYVCVQDLIAHERYLTRLDDDQRAIQAAVSVLEGEEEIARQEWLAKKRDAEALDKLREKALVEWNMEQEREDQKALDEWAVTRRSA